MPGDKLLTTKEAAEYLNVSPSFLEKDRTNKKEVPFLRLGGIIRYRREDLMAYLDSLKHH